MSDIYPFTPQISHLVWAWPRAQFRQMSTCGMAERHNSFSRHADDQWWDNNIVTQTSSLWKLELPITLMWNESKSQTNTRTSISRQLQIYLAVNAQETALRAVFVGATWVANKAHRVGALEHRAQTVRPSTARRRGTRKVMWKQVSAAQRISLFQKKLTQLLLHGFFFFELASLEYHAICLTANQWGNQG